MDDADAGIYAVDSEALGRVVQVGIAGDRVISVSFPGTPDGEATTGHPVLDRIESYLAGAEDTFEDVAVALTVPTDRRAVLETVREVPYGRSVTVEELTNMTPGLDADETDDVETVRTALATNPAPILIPDHRVRDGPSGAPAAVASHLRSVEGL